MYRWVDHTAEVELEVEARTEPEVFADALAALAELLGFGGEGAGGEGAGGEGAGGEGDPGAPEAAQTRLVSATAPDRPALLAAWLEELVFLAESEGFVATRVEELDLSARELTATVKGIVDEPPPLVKAVTYHGLVFEPSDTGYVARVVLDV